MSPDPRRIVPPRTPRLLRHLALHLVLGAAFGVAFTAFLVGANVTSLGDLIEGSGSPLLAKTMLCAANVLTFGSLAMGISVMTLPWGEAMRGEKDEP